ncbi:hypothetical protein Purlil1_10546 [Purpureocillium lilacinum]|uniref:Uncharacterized protein n=1 Tax=Purpureocillium lilacinum TaxID=33203 RepID=A0ABR0BME4_PURLI|nr:hypothetical protein Purlil1_10546 [Purpureocillium lilacinum]
MTVASSVNSTSNGTDNERYTCLHKGLLPLLTLGVRQRRRPADRAWSSQLRYTSADYVPDILEESSAPFAHRAPCRYTGARPGLGKSEKMALTGRDSGSGITGHRSISTADLKNHDVCNEVVRIHINSPGCCHTSPVVKRLSFGFDSASSARVLPAKRAEAAWKDLGWLMDEASEFQSIPKDPQSRSTAHDLVAPTHQLGILPQIHSKADAYSRNEGPASSKAPLGDLLPHLADLVDQRTASVMTGGPGLPSSTTPALRHGHCLSARFQARPRCSGGSRSLALEMDSRDPHASPC